jgi:formylmethanofuran dehydrogenase subunit E
VKPSTEITSQIENAVKLHGHLGPFLVIGVRMGEMAKRHLGVDEKTGHVLLGRIKIPFSTPFSCVIDGIQATTGCTVGNQRLKTEKSRGEITAIFKLRGSDKSVKILVNRELVKNLNEQMSRGADSENLAADIACLKEEQLFELEER